MSSALGTYPRSGAGIQPHEVVGAYRRILARDAGFKPAAEV
jgi:hypothetical protein